MRSKGDSTIFTFVAVTSVLVVIDSILVHYLKDIKPFNDVLVALSLSFLLYLIVYFGIPRLGECMLLSNFYGYDLHRPAMTDPSIEKEKIPESVGLLCGVCYIFGSCIYIWFCKKTQLVEISDFCAALFSITFMLLFGLIDDLIDPRWRYKILYPVLGSLPLVSIYSGPTWIRLPAYLEPFVPTSKWSFHGLVVDLKSYYGILIIAISLFTSNATNIYAGINGIEVGQNLVISVFIILYCCIELVKYNSLLPMSSIVNCLLFMHVSAALWIYNKYPAKVFVGNCYTLFAGMYLASVAVLGHYTKTLLLFCIPQIINLLLSVPQLTLIVRCPKHRVPDYEAATNKLRASKNGTLLNLWLWLRGNMTEKQLCIELLLFQVACCFFGLAIRYSSIYYTYFQ